MNLVPSDDELEIVASIERFLSKELSIAHLRDRLREEMSLPPSAWRDAGEIGVFSLGLSADAGGSGFSTVEEALVFRVMGRHLAPVGFIAATVGGRLANKAGKVEVRDRILSGVAPVGIGIGRRGASAGVHPSGEFDLFDLDGASYLLLVDGDGVSLVDPEGIAVEVLDCLDPATSMGRGDLSGATVIAAAEGSDALPELLLGALLTTAVLVGISEATKDAGSSYAKERIQFGKPIGVHQAIKHRCADMAVRCEAAVSLLFFAAVALREEREDTEFQVRAAKVIATRAALENARSNIQIHGGMGFTWEHDAHLYLSRYHLLSELFGSVDDHKQRLLALKPASL